MASSGFVTIDSIVKEMRLPVLIEPIADSIQIIIVNAAAVHVYV